MEDVIVVEQLSKSYGPLAAVRNLSFTVGRGQIFGLLGANGAGKSTTVECILGTKQADGGRATILGLDPRQARRQLFERVGVQFQEAHYQEKITVAELCQVTAALYRQPQDYRTLLSQLGLADKIKNQVADLSGGERQKLFIALALIPAPEVVFLDELTTGLDARARREVWKILAGLQERGLSILLTSHFMDEVETLCDRILILKQGQAIFQGTVAEAVAGSPHTAFEDAYLWYTDEEVVS